MAAEKIGERLAMQSQSTGGLDGFGRRRCLIDGIDQRQATAEQAGAEAGLTESHFIPSLLG
jgi:hypothetical protein